jgi:type IX secretion system PorP/SprF family membrane protein
MSKSINLFCLLLLLSTVYAQDMQFTQAYSAPLYMNPAFAGADVCSRVSLTHRTQWNGINKGYSTFLASYDNTPEKTGFAFGMLVGRDIAGSGDLERLLFTPIIAYELRLSRTTTIRAGFQAGLNQIGINYRNLIFGDQIVRGGNVTTVEQLPGRTIFMDIGSGILLNSKTYWAGIALYHLNRPNESLMSSSYVTIPVKAHIHGGYRFILDENNGYNNNPDKSVVVAANYKTQGKYDQLDIGVYYNTGIVSLGVWYRGLPLFKRYAPGFSNNDALAFIAGIEKERFRIGYSYDVTISRLSIASRGAHEVSLAYQFCDPKKIKKRAIAVYCPKF